MSNQPPNSSSPNRWPCAVVLIAALLIAGGAGFFLIWHFVNGVEKVADAPALLLNNLAAAFKPTTSATTVIHTAIGTLNHEAKLVVLTTTIDAEIDKSSSTNWGYIYWGTTQVTLRAHDNKIQYTIPLLGLDESAFTFDPKTNRVIFHAPVPRLDESMVDVQSDPQKIDIQTSLGWAKFDSWSGEPLRQEARADLRNAVIAAGKHELLEDQARRDGKTALLKLLSPLATELRDGITLDVVFDDPHPPVTMPP